MQLTERYKCKYKSHKPFLPTPAFSLNNTNHTQYKKTRWQTTMCYASSWAAVQNEQAPVIGHKGWENIVSGSMFAHRKWEPCCSTQTHIHLFVVTCRRCPVKQTNIHESVFSGFKIKGNYYVLPKFLSHAVLCKRPEPHFISSHPRSQTLSRLELSAQSPYLSIFRGTSFVS